MAGGFALLGLVSPGTLTPFTHRSPICPPGSLGIGPTTISSWGLVLSGVPLGHGDHGYLLLSGASDFLLATGDAGGLGQCNAHFARGPSPNANVQGRRLGSFVDSGIIYQWFIPVSEPSYAQRGAVAPMDFCRGGVEYTIGRWLILVDCAADLMERAIDKVALRKALIRQRLSLDPKVVQDDSRKICDRLQSLPQFQSARTILAYLSYRQEPDLSLLWTVSQSIRWGLPRCVGKELVFHKCDPANSTHFKTGAYGIQEPLPALPILQPETVDLILVPAVACDRQGYRLGYGAGYYDRLFAKSEWAKIPAIGIMFHHALLENIPRDSWDRPLQSICTEQELVTVIAQKL